MVSDRVIINLNIIFSLSDFSDAQYLILRNKVFNLMLQKAFPATEATPLWGHITLADNSATTTTAFAAIKADDLFFEESIQPNNWMFNLHDFYTEDGRNEDVRIRVSCDAPNTIDRYYKPLVQVRLPSLPLETFKSRLPIFEEVSHEIFRVFNKGRGNLYTTSCKDRSNTTWIELQ